MKKNILLAFLFSSFYLFQVNAQVTLDHDTLIVDIPAGLTDVVGHNTVTNTSDELKKFRWVRNQVTLPSEWESAVCDPNFCYLPTTDSIEFDLGPGASGLLDVHLYPDVFWNGYALIEVTIKEVDDPSNAITGVYIFDSEFTSTNEVNQIQFKVYPNPSSGLFTLEGETEQAAFITVFNTYGQRLIHTPVQGGDWYDISNLSQGNYLVQLSTKDGRPMGTKLIAKY